MWLNSNKADEGFKVLRVTILPYLSSLDALWGYSLQKLSIWPGTGRLVFCSVEGKQTLGLTIRGGFFGEKPYDHY